MKKIKLKSVRVSAPAKINLFLEVTGKRPDGYHDLVTLFAKITLADELLLKKASKPGISLTLTDKAGIAAIKPGDNIVYKAALAFLKAFEIAPALEIKLLKKIPAGAGLGGGSSDAASTLKGLCELYGINFKKNKRRLAGIALELGSDVPFFLTDQTFAAGFGRGEVLKSFPASTKKLPEIALVYPGEPVFTGPVFKALGPVNPVEVKKNLKNFTALTRALKSGQPLSKWGHFLFNRLEGPVLPEYPAVKNAKLELQSSGAQAVLMSGSGASVFSLEGSSGAKSRLKKIKKHNYKVFPVKFLLKS